MALTETFAAIRRKAGSGNSKTTKSAPIRLSGTDPNTLDAYEADPKDAGLDNDNPNGRTGNDWYYPDNFRGRFDVDQVNGDRLQDQTGRHIHEGEAPGRIPRGWNNRIQGKVGLGLTGNPSGEQTPGITITGEQGGGTQDMMFIPHTPTPRGITVARTYLRTVDDAANIPGVYVTDATRH